MSGSWAVVLVVVVGATQFFDPTELGIIPLGAPRAMHVGPGNFNPSIAPIDKDRYIVAYRQKDHSCHLQRRLGAQGSRLWIVDGNFEPVTDVRTATGKKWIFDHTDARVEAVAGSILITATRYHHKKKELIQIWNARWLDLDEVNGTVRATSKPVVHPDIKGNSEIWRHGKNYGVLYSEKSFRLLHWLTAGFVDIRQGIPPPKAGDRVNIRIHNKTLSNNGSPVQLSVPNFMLSVGHVHIDSRPAFHRNWPNATKFGNTYLHSFVVFRNDTYRHCATSRPFCFPSLDDASKCDLIQFVMTILRLPSNNNFLLTYGVNDCISATVELSELDILDFIFHSSSGSDDESGPAFIRRNDSQCAPILLHR